MSMEVMNDNSELLTSSLARAMLQNPPIVDSSAPVLQLDAVGLQKASTLSSELNGTCQLIDILSSSLTQSVFKSGIAQIHEPDFGDFESQFDSAEWNWMRLVVRLVLAAKHQLVKQLTLSGSTSTFNSNDYFIVVLIAFSYSVWFRVGPGSIGMVNMDFGKVTNMMQADLRQVALMVGGTILGGWSCWMGWRMALREIGLAAGDGGDVGRVSCGGEGLVSGRLRRETLI
ncbi:hypothetical protein BYT27DRAFT_7208840 [Phlegmacium glaucopus]|nr:hypothetical protein BYT27DRAFT_7208840 [Phlegmacium glaucopus]